MPDQDQEQELGRAEAAGIMRTRLRSVLAAGIAAAEKAIADVQKAEADALAKVTPPDISEKTAHEIKRQYPGDKPKAYATMWAIHNRMKKSGGMAKSEAGAEVDGMTRCPDCKALVKVDGDGRLEEHKVGVHKGDKGKAECPGSGRQGYVKGGPNAPQKKVEHGAGEDVEKNEEMGYSGVPMAMSKSSISRAMRSYDTKAKTPPAPPPRPQAPPTPRHAKVMPVVKGDLGYVGGDAPKVRGSILARQQSAAPKKPAPTGVRGMPADKIPPRPAPMGKASPPPIPPAAVKHPSASPEGLPLAGTKIPPRVPGTALGGKLAPTKLPGMPGTIGGAPKPELMPVTAPKGPRAPTMGFARVPGIHKAEAKGQTAGDKAAVHGANKELGAGFKSVASSPTAFPGGKFIVPKVAKAEGQGRPHGTHSCKSCGFEYVPDEGATQEDHYEGCKDAAKLPKGKKSPMRKTELCKSCGMTMHKGAC